jgi:hypothetical protein
MDEWDSCLNAGTSGGFDTTGTGSATRSHLAAGRKGIALDLLRRREGAIADGVPVTAKINRFRFEEAATDLITEYKVNKRRSLDELERRIEKHLTPCFGGRSQPPTFGPISRNGNRRRKS